MAASRTISQVPSVEASSRIDNLVGTSVCRERLSRSSGSQRTPLWVARTTVNPGKPTFTVGQPSNLAASLAGLISLDHFADWSGGPHPPVFDPDRPVTDRTPSL